MEQNVRNLIALDICNNSLGDNKINFRQFVEMVEEFGGENSSIMKTIGWFSLADKIISTMVREYSSTNMYDSCVFCKDLRELAMKHDVSVYAAIQTSKGK